MSGPTQTAPTPYQPANQPGADAAFQQGANQLLTAGQNQYGQVAPQLAGITSAVANNPYYAQAQAGAQGAANTAVNTVAPQQFAGAAQDTSLANMTAGAAPGYANAATQGGVNAYNTTQGLLPAATAGIGQAQGQLSAADLAAVQSYLGLTGAIPGLTQGMGAANAVLQQGFDPQNTLYNQQYAQQQDQQNAINAMNGVAGSPYAAGVSGQQSQNFNTQWENQKLGREESALGAYGTEQSTVASAATGANAAASTLGTKGLDTQAQAAQLPYDLALQQDQAQLQALLAQIQGTNASLAPTQQGVTDQGAYLNIGQTAGQGAINAAQANNQATAAASAGLGNLFGDVLGMFKFAPIALGGL
jgi:hypothetical protein